VSLRSKASYLSAATTGLSIAVSITAHADPLAKVDPARTHHSDTQLEPATELEPPPREKRSASFSDRFFSGSSANPGEPSSLKVVSIGTLYGLSILSLGGAGYFAIQSFDAKSDADDLRDDQPEGSCVGYASEACEDYAKLRRDQRDDAFAAYIFFAGGALLGLGGALAAELWPNVVADSLSISAAAAPHAAALTIRLRL
jgi:hypothetical protein